MKTIQTLDEFAELIQKIIDSDRYCVLVSDGETGEGKSCFTSQLAKKISFRLQTHFSYQDNMTYSRNELVKWISEKPERTVILADEFISLFFKRNFMKGGQIKALELLNKCRDRHMVIIGNIPNFWDLDISIFHLIKFWVHIYRRGIAWVFIKSDNPFDRDKWQRGFNSQIFSTKGTPYSCYGFVCEIHFGDWFPEEKEKYYTIRNEKRKNTELQDAEEEEEQPKPKKQKREEEEIDDDTMVDVDKFLEDLQRRREGKNVTND